MTGLRKALFSLPKSLDETYTRLLLKIDSEYRREAYVALQWLAFSFRPLQVEEIAEAVMIQPGRFSLRAEERLRDPRDILEICSSLVVLSPQGEVRLAHYSVKEFLISERIGQSSASAFAIIPGDADKDMATVCLTYLLSFNPPSSLREVNSVEFPLLHYSAQNWYRHARFISAEHARANVDALAFQLLRPGSGSEFANWLSVAAPDIFNYMPTFEPGLETLGSPLYYASYCGLLNVARRLLDLGEDVNEQSGMYGSALNAAAYQGDLAMVKLLIGAGANIEGRSTGHQKVMEQGWLHVCQEHTTCMGSQYDTLTKHLQSLSTGGDTKPQEQAVRHVNDNVMALRQDCGFSIQHAAFVGNMRAVKLLLADQSAASALPANINSALQAAAFAGNQDTVNLLLAEGANVNSQGGPCGNAMRAAISQKHYHIMKILIMNGYQREGDATPLQWASWNGHLEVLEHLISEGADMEAEDPRSATVLHWAAWNGHSEVMRVLLAKGANPDTQDSAGGSPLHFAAYSGQETVIRILLHNGAHVNARAKFRYSTIRDGSLDFERRTAPDRTPLHEAAHAGMNGAIRLLVDQGADTSAQDSNGWTALQRAAVRGYTDTVHLLMELGAQ